MLKKTPDPSSNVPWFVLGLFLTSIVGSAFHGTFHNYLDDIFKIGADQRGSLEFPRELPGLLAAFIIGAVFFMGELRILTLSVLLAGLGFLGLGYCKSSFYTMIAFMFLWSTGTHIHMSLRDPVAMGLSRSGKKGYVLGRINGIRSAGIIVGTLLIWLFMGKLNADYTQIYTAAFVICILSACCYSRIKKNDSPQQKPGFTLVFKRRYILFYLLAATFGVRKQLFLVFGPWLLIKRYELKAQDIALLLLCSAIAGVIIKPLLGRVIDVLGERTVLMMDAVLIFLLSISYALGPVFLEKGAALPVLCVCFVVDEILFTLRAARTTYLYKILETRNDLTPTLSMGLSIEHVVSMTTPVLGGIIWVNFGYYWVFVIAAGIAVVSGAMSSFIPKRALLDGQHQGGNGRIHSSSPRQ